MTAIINVKKLDERAIIPTYKTPGSAGFDIHALHGGSVQAGWRATVDTGLAFEIPEGFTVRENQSAYIEMGLYQFSVLDAQGEMQLSFMNRVTGLGGACPPDLEKLTVEEFDVIPLSVPGYMAPKEPGAIPVNGFRFAYRVSQLSDRVLVMFAGRITADLRNGPHLTSEALGPYMLGLEKAA